MNLQAIFHNPLSNYAYAFSENELHIRLRTAKDDCETVGVYIAKKHLWDKKKKHIMQKFASDNMFDYYQYNFSTNDCRIGYYFELSDGRKTYVYSESGFSDSFDDKNAYFHYFQYPYINKIDVHKIPEWVHTAVFYQIFVERFYNGDKSNDPENITKWGEFPSPKSFYGGDLQGIIDKLDYLCDLGINGIYLTPIFESPSNHKYDTTDYRKIDSMFGDKDKLCELVEKAHKKEIRIVLDGVFNHCGYDFEYFQDALKNREKSKYYNWFYFDNAGDDSTDCDYRVFANAVTMPKLNMANPEVKKYILDTVAFWTEQTNIDGWRLDVSDEIDLTFWLDFRKTVKGINSEAIILGENWHNSYAWLSGGRFDGVMNYPVDKACIEYFAMKKITAKRFCEYINEYQSWYSDQVKFAMLNLLDSHDTVRFLTLCNGNKEVFKLAVLFLFSYIGMTCTYYGSEIGMEGNGDPDCRRTFDWNKENWDTDLYEYYKTLIKIRHTQKALGYGSFMIDCVNEVIIISREVNGEKIKVYINNNSAPKKIKLDNTNANIIFGENKLQNNYIILKPMTGTIINSGIINKEKAL